jgi:hypothetical protein
MVIFTSIARCAIYHTEGYRRSLKLKHYDSVKIIITNLHIMLSLDIIKNNSFC